ncbi:MAG: phospholipid carrier-dependent glycosyltransferase [Bacteroidales bacterium]|nr:phospholipid carrier-dependent glycosyltransferase [Bacteroidales bacterium]
MTLNFKVILSKIATIIRKFILRSQIYDDPPMELHFDKLRQPKRVYDIRKKYFTFSIKSKDDIYKYLFYLLMLMLLIVLPYASIQTGISDIEWEQVKHIESINAGETQPSEIPYMRNHGMILDKITYAAAKWISPNDPYAVRHVTSALFGWGTILVVGLFMLRLFSWRAAFFGALFLFVSPRFIGHTYSNLTDIPFAFAYVFTLYQLHRLFEELPVIKRQRIALLLISVILCCSIHVGGTILLIYIIVLLPLFYFINNPIRKFSSKEYLKNFALIFGMGVAVALITYIVCWIIYPDNQFFTVSPSFALSQMTANRLPVKQLFEGRLILSNQAPPHYLIKYLFITTPLVILICFALSIFMIKTAVKKAKLINIIAIVFAFIYPIIYFVNHSSLNVYEGIAQYMFIYPVFVIIATAGYESLLEKVDDRYTNIVIVGVGIFLTLLPFRNLLLNHPHSIIYFNEISGGIHNAYGQYELDPHRQTNREACTKFIKLLKERTLREHNDDSKIVVCTNGNKACEQFFKNDTAYIELRFCDFGQRHEEHWDYFISFPYKLSGYELKNGIWFADENTFDSIMLERMPIVVYFKNRSNDTIK